MTKHSDSSQSPDTPANPSRRTAIKQILALPLMATAPATSNAGTWENIVSATKQDAAANNDNLNITKLVARIDTLSKEGESKDSPILTPVQQRTLVANLGKGYTILSFQFSMCSSICTNMQETFRKLEEKNKASDPATHINYLTIDAAANAPEALKDTIATRAKVEPNRIFVYSPPQMNMDAAKTMQHDVGFMTSDIIKREGDLIKDIGHSPYMHIFAPDGTLLTKDSPINGTKPDAADKIFNVIQNHTKTKSPSSQR